jgi:membrane protein DedA with SNARE-associated domain
MTPAVDRRRLALLLLPFALSALASTLGVALAPMLLVHAPLGLVALSPLGRHLLLASPHIDTWLLFAVALPRMFIVDPFMYVLGRDYGEIAMREVVDRLGGAGRWVRWLDRIARKASWLLVLLWADPLVCTLAGASRLDPRAFVALNLAGTLGALALVKASNEALAGPVGWVQRVLTDHTLTATLVSVLVVAVAVGLRWAARRPAEER